MPNTNLTTKNYLSACREMVERDLVGRDITDPNILEAMSKVPREEFVETKLRDTAYGDYPIRIGHHQTISQPYIVALMLQHLNINSGDKVLDIGTGSGYHAAVMAQLGAQVYSIDIIEELSKKAGKTLQRLGYNTILLKHGDGYEGWPEHAPFEEINIACAVNRIPMPLIEQLADAGRMIFPLTDPRDRLQQLTMVKKVGNKIITRGISYVAFVPMQRKRKI